MLTNGSMLEGQGQYCIDHLQKVYHAALELVLFYSQDFKVRMAVDVSLAALLGENIYSFGQLLQHPIAAALDHGPHQWLHEMLKVCFNRVCLFHVLAKYHPFLPGFQ